MRIRKKAWARPELDACDYYIPNPQKLKGRWAEHFGKKRPLHLDLGCGKCVFLAEAAEKNRDVNFIGIDLSYDILGVGRRNIETVFINAEDKKTDPDNILICYYNIEKLTDIISKDDGVERLYINFCNPWPSASHHKRRLTHTRQLEKYRDILSDNGEIWFKTDNDDLYLGTKRYFEQAGFEIFFDTTDLHNEANAENILTEHELMFTSQGIKTKAIRARLK